MRPLGIDIAKMHAGEPLPANLVPDCPGANLRLTRHDFDAFVRGGDIFRTERKDVPVDGYGDARISCNDAVEPIIETASKTALFYGLCVSCSRLEADNRATLRERQGSK